MTLNLVLINTVNGPELWCVPTTIIPVLSPWITYASLELSADELRHMLRNKPANDIDTYGVDLVYFDLSASTLFVRLQSLESEQLERVDIDIVHDECVANWMNCHYVSTPEYL